jgi:nucleoside-triphosphatase THEP1
MELGRPVEHGRILVVSGDFGSGKSIFCQQAAARLGSTGLDVKGVLSPGRFDGGKKTGFWCEEIASGERRLLASAIEGEIDGEKFGMWTFDPAVIAWGNRILDGIREVDILIIDEIGPLELNLGRGWVRAFDALSQAKFRSALVVIRPTCVKKFQARGYLFGIFDWQLETEREGWFRSL